MRRTGAIVVLLAMAAAAAAQAEDIPALVRALGDADSANRIPALNRLQALKDPRALPLLTEALPGFDLLGKYYGMLVVDSYPLDLAAKAARALVSSADPYLRVAAASILLSSGDERAAEVVAKGLRTEDLPRDARLYMLYRLMNATHPKVLAAVRGLLRPEEDATVLGQVFEILASRQDREAVPVVEKLLAEAEKGSVRAMAAAWLLRLGQAGRAADLARELREGGVDVNEFFRVKNLLWPLSRLPEEVLDAVVEMIEKAPGNVSVLQSAVDLLAKYRHRKAIPVLKKLLNHENRLVAKAAFEGLAGLAGALDPETLLPMLTAEDLDRRLWAADALRRMDDLAGLAPVLNILNSGTDEQRRDAARILGGFRAQAVVEPLLTAMLDQDQSVRMNAGNSLQSVLGSLFPYRRLDFSTVGWAWNATPEARSAAVGRIREWWVQARQKNW